MKDVVLRVLLGLVKKDQLIGFIAGAIMAVAAGVLGMTPVAVKSAVCAAPVVQLPIK